MNLLTGIGNTTAFTANAAKAADAANTASNIAAMLTKPGNPAYQSSTSKTALKAANVAGTIAAASLAIPQPAGAAVAAAAAVVAGVAKLVAVITFNDPAKKINAEAGKYELANNMLRDENYQLDMEILKLKKTSEDLRKYFGLRSNNPVNGLGIMDIIEARQKLHEQKATYAELQVVQQKKLALIDALVTEVDQLVTAKETKQAGLLVAGALLVIGAGVAIYYNLD